MRVIEKVVGLSLFVALGTIAENVFHGSHYIFRDKCLFCVVLFGARLGAREESTPSPPLPFASRIRLLVAAAESRPCRLCRHCSLRINGNDGRLSRGINGHFLAPSLSSRRSLVYTGDVNHPVSAASRKWHCFCLVAALERSSNAGKFKNHIKYLWSAGEHGKQNGHIMGCKIL